MWLACQRLSFPRPGPLEALHRGALGLLLRHRAPLVATERSLRRSRLRPTSARSPSSCCALRASRRPRSCRCRPALAATRSSTALPSSRWAICRPRNIIVTFTLFPSPQELPRVAGLELEVVVVDAGTVLHFLELDDVLLLLGRPRRLGLFELELPVVHDLDHGRARRRRHFHEVQPAFLRRGQRLFDGQDAQLLAVAP